MEALSPPLKWRNLVLHIKLVDFYAFFVMRIHPLRRESDLPKDSPQKNDGVFLGKKIKSALNLVEILVGKFQAGFVDGRVLRISNSSSKISPTGLCQLAGRDGRSHELAEMGPQFSTQQKNGPSSSQ